MSVQIEIPNSPRKQKVTNWEKYGWLYMRISGPLLIVLIFTHVFVNLFTGEGIKQIDFAFVAGKWADPFWQWWDVSMLWLALIHGTLGMRTIIHDYTEKPKLKTGLVGTLWSVSGSLILLGTLVVFTFDPCPATADPNLLPSFCEAIASN
jgi:succinate dehydrogenase / fumarate reductase membrane anchor subunit